MRKLVIAAAVAAAALVPAGAAQAQQRWSTIGFRTVSTGVDRDSIAVRGTQRHRQVRICAFNQPIRLIAIGIRFRNGGVQNERLGTIVRGGTCSRPFDLRGRRRDMTRIDLTYDRLARGLGPLIRVQAR
jgi:hypothetical protein